MNRISPFLFSAYSKLIDPKKNHNHPQNNTHKKNTEYINPPPLPPMSLPPKKKKKMQGIGHISRGGGVFSGVLS